MGMIDRWKKISVKNHVHGRKSDLNHYDELDEVGQGVQKSMLVFLNVNVLDGME